MNNNDCALIINNYKMLDMQRYEVVNNNIIKIIRMGSFDNKINIYWCIKSMTIVLNI